jgi:hypothetical protein
MSILFDPDVIDEIEQPHIGKPIDGMVAGPLA